MQAANAERVDTTTAEGTMVLPVKPWTRTSRCTPLETGTAKACSYPCHAQKAGTTQKWYDPLPSWVKNRERRHTPGQHFQADTLHLDGLVTVQIQFPLHTATLALELEPGKDVVVGANLVVVAEPDSQQAYTPTTSWYWK